MNILIARWLLAISTLAALLGTSALGWAQSVDSAYRSSPLAAYPPNLGFGATGPMMMLTASKDHTLFSPIYTDYEDIDGDGTDDFTFKPTFKYYGYFDAGKCYLYNAAWSDNKGRFEPAIQATLESGTGRLSCPRGQSYWSGNFLNWATMTRLDVVRKTLYGGFRREDTDQSTTLEMALLTQDAHSFVKYYSGADVADYTPFDASTNLQDSGITICNRSSNRTDPGTADYPMMRVVRGNFSLWATTPGTVCNWGDGTTNGFVFGNKVRAFYAKYGPSQGAVSQDPTAHKTLLPVASTDGLRASSAGPDFAVRVQACKVGLTEGERCQAYTRTLSDGTTAVGYKPIGLLQEFGTAAEALKASRAEFGLITGSFDSNLRGGALRKNVGSVNDEVERASGRFCHNIPSASLPAECRKAAGQLRDEGIIRTFDRIRLYDAGNFNASAAGTRGFVTPKEIVNGQFPSWGNPMSEMVVQALAYFAGRPLFDQPASMTRDTALNLPVNVAPRDPLSNSSLDAASGLARGSLYGKAICRPMHLLAISSGSVSFDAPGGTDGDTYSSADYFLRANGQADNLAVWTDRVGDASREGINGSKRSVGSATGGFGTDCTAKLLGSGQGVGTTYSAGLSGVAGVCPEAPGVKGAYIGAGAAFMANTRAIRNLGASTTAALSTAAGLTADTGANVLQANLPPSALRVKSYAASLAGGVARIEIPIGNTGRKVFITPESTWDHGRDIPDLMPGAMLTFRALYAGPVAGTNHTSGAYVVTWNDAQFGGDYDMDLVGFIRWELSPVSGQAGAYNLTVFTDVLGHDAGAAGSHGFSIIGTDEAPDDSFKPDGRYLTHGSNGYWKTGRCSELGTTSDAYNLSCQFTNLGLNSDRFAWPTAFKGVSDSVGFIDQVGTGTVRYSTTVATKFRVTAGADAVTLRDPLWYMAKYGSFDTQEGNTFAVSTTASPQTASATSRQSTNWDSQNNSGAACVGTACADGEPDGYFLARRPELLESRLRQLLERISQANGTTPALSSSQLISGSIKYVTRFSPDSFSGDVEAYALGADGNFPATPTYRAGPQLTSSSAGATAAPSRQVITNDGFVGKPFIWGSAGLGIDTTPSYARALTGASDTDTTLTAAQAQQAADLVAYMRGASALERVKFRARETGNLMGPVVNSTPWVQDSQSAARYTDADFPSSVPSYRAFALSKTARASVLWVGANDGMLHGFRASDLRPLLSYVPSPLAGRLGNALAVTTNSAVPLADGSPFTADVLVPSGSSSVWSTYLFSSLGRGGRAVFALDVTGAGGLLAGGSDAEALSESRAGSIFRWVFTAADDADLGYGLVAPVRHGVSGQASQVVYLNNGKFAVLVPNGHGSGAGRAVLFIVNAEGPGGSATSWKDSANQPVGYTKLLTNSTDSGNGLMGATWVDLDNNGTADVVYATDLKGQVWKFDIRSNNPANWRSALLSGGAPVPLFTARIDANTSLPITTAPVVSFPSFGGTMVSFGTGRAIDSADFPDTSVVQRFFSVWDKGRYAEDQIFPPASATAANPLPSVLRTVSQTVGSGASAQTTTVPAFLKRVLRRSSDGFVYQVLTNAQGEPLTASGSVATSQAQEVPLLDNAAAVGFDPAVNDGWFFQFPEAGEAVLSSPQARQNFVLFTSVRPQSSTVAAQSCSVAPLGTVYGFNPINGLPVAGLLRTYVIRDASGAVVSTVNAMGNDLGKDQGGIVVRDGSPLTERTCDANQNCTTKEVPRCAAGKIASRFMSANSDINGCVSANDLRIQWREIPGMKTR